MTGKVIQLVKVSPAQLMAVCEDGSIWKGAMILSNDIVDRLEWVNVYRPEVVPKK